MINNHSIIPGRVTRAVILTFCLILSTTGCISQTNSDSVIWLEAEQFDNTGGWSNDSQFVDLMGSPYLLATGCGTPVADAATIVNIPAAGTYHLWVRCKDWFPDNSPGQFKVEIGQETSSITFGKAVEETWQWANGGAFDLETGDIEIQLHDLTGWWGRCDAVVLANKTFKPANDLDTLAKQRLKFLGVSTELKNMGSYDVVVVGGGLSGCGAAVSAARNGSKVALIQDRPVLGGNSSSEIQVPVMGHCTWRDFNKYDPGITGIIEEFYPEIGQTARSKEIKEIVRKEKNISLLLNTRATNVEMTSPTRIKSVLALNAKTGQRLRFTAPLFIDCTGHGWVGYWAGAEYRQGQEPRSEFNESLAPIQAGKKTMGNDLYNAEFLTFDKPVEFKCPQWAYQWKSPDDFEVYDSHVRLDEVRRPENFDRPSRGKGRQPNPDDISGGTYHQWWLEYGGIMDIITDAETIRDELFRINIGLWNYAKNHNPKTIEENKNRQLAWLNYVCGVRESRRLIGDHIMSQAEYDNRIVHEDTAAFTDWGIDVHHPEGFWVKGNDCIHVYCNERVSIPYRSLYSKNISNLLMAGRCISVTHIALGGTRIMRTCCMTGQAAGTAAAIATKHNTQPQDIYRNHIEQLQQLLLKDGCYLIGIPNNDRADLALTATVTASSSADGMTGENINNGWNRIVENKRNAWSPDPKAKLPQWIKLQLKRAFTINTLHVSFQKNEYSASDFTVEAHLDGSWKEIAEVSDNQARRCVLNFDPVRTDKIRITFTKAPADLALCEVRLYNES